MNFKDDCDELEAFRNVRYTPVKNGLVERSREEWLIDHGMEA